MITLTIDQDIKLKKTHFANPLEAIYFLASVQIKNNKTESQGSKVKKVMEEYRKGVDIVSLSDYMTKRGLIA